MNFRSLNENIDTSNSGGKLMFHIFSALAEFERDLIRERTMAGLTAARARGRFGGRPQDYAGREDPDGRQPHAVAQRFDQGHLQESGNFAHNALSLRWAEG